MPATTTQFQIRDIFIHDHPFVGFGLGDWREYQDGVWEVISEYEIHKRVQHITEKYNGTQSNGAITSVMAMIKALTYVKDEAFDSLPNIIVFEDTCYNFVSGTTLPHSPHHYATAKLPFKYDPEAKSPEWETFLAHCPHPEFLQEFAGYCLTPDTRHELALWLYGPPGGGKSTFISALETMLGTKACILGLNEIERSSYALSQLPGKTLAISTEQPSRYIKSPHIINAIISGESLTVERKFINPYKITSHAKVVWAMNELPRVDTGGVGLFRRIIPVFWAALADEERNPAIKEGILTSGAAITNWALTGLLRLRERGKFAVPAQLLADRDTYRSQNDILQLFLDECCEQLPAIEIQSSKIFAAYQAWCFKNNLKPFAINRFADEMQRHGILKERRKDAVYWLGVDLTVDNFNVEIH